MPEIEQLDQVLDTQTLTASELLLAALIIIVSVLIARYARGIVQRRNGFALS